MVAASIVPGSELILTDVMTNPLRTGLIVTLREMGAVALRTALRMAAGEALDSHHVELATELVVRKSTAPPG